MIGSLLPLLSVASCVDEPRDCVGTMITTFSQGQVVNVMQRQWSGVNKQGGIARITRVNSDDTLAVSYIIGDYKEAAVNTKVRVVDTDGRGRSQKT